MARQSLSKNFTPRVQLRLACEMAGWSQIEVADRLGIGQVTVSHWETGETTPSAYYCQRLSLLFGKTREDLGLGARRPSSPPAVAPRREEAIIDPAIPPLPHIPLVGREEDLVALRTQLCDEQTTTLAVCGLPGVGKTTLACTLHQTIADYARLHLDHQHPHERFIAYALTFLEGHPLDYETLAQERSTLLLALETASTLGHQRELVRATCIMAPFLILRGNYVLAQHHLEHAQQAALVLQDQVGLTTILLHLGDVAGRQGDYVHSQKVLQEGYKVIVEESQRWLLAQMKI